MRILLVRLRQIGDVVFTTPAIHALRRRFPDAHLAYIVEPPAAAVVIHNPHLNEVIVAPRAAGIRGFADDVALGRRLRDSRYDLVIDFHGGPRASLLTWLSGAPTRIGYHVIGRSWMYTQRVARPRSLRPRHSVENQWDLLEVLDIVPPDRVRFPVEMPVEHETARSVVTRLANAGVEPADRVVVVHVSAGNPFRRWPMAHFVRLVTAPFVAGQVVRRRSAVGLIARLIPVPGPVAVPRRMGRGTRSELEHDVLVIPLYGPLSLHCFRSAEVVILFSTPAVLPTQNVGAHECRPIPAQSHGIIEPVSEHYAPVKT